jgi:NitT/TauT family transport system substrate-binding protein
VKHAVGPPLWERVASGEVDLATFTSVGGVKRIEAGDPVVILGGYHAGCFELFGNDRVHAIRDRASGEVDLATYRRSEATGTRSSL